MHYLIKIAAFALILVAASCSQGKENKNKDSVPSLFTDVSDKSDLPPAEISFANTLINFGTKPEGEIVHLSYKFKNTGSNPLFIKEVRPTCGCTIAEYNKDAIPPGGEGEIKADFNTAQGGNGQIHKRIIVVSNDADNPNDTLAFTGIVTEAKF